MSKELIVSVNGREKKIAIVEDDLVTEFYVERGDENQGIVGNIYKGRVMKVLPGMQSAFVDIGLERDSFLYVSDFFDEEEMEEGGEERREAPRPSGRYERGRPPHRPEAPRTESVIAVSATGTDAEEIDDEKEHDLHAVAISHIEELAEEPVIEIMPDEDLPEVAEAEVEPVRQPREGGRSSSRQRRQRRLSYSDESPEERPERPERPEEVAVSVRDLGEESEESGTGVRAEAEEEYGGRRRRRPRRRRGGGSGEEEQLPTPVEEPLPAEDFAEEIVAEPAEEPVGEAIEEEDLPERHEVEGVPVGSLSQVILAHHEPLERVVDEDGAAVEGDLLKDAMIQERISGRIHGEERVVSMVEVEPTPEVTVGSLHAGPSSSSGLERISDDADPLAVEDPADPPVEESLEDGAAELRHQPDKAEFATRRGGRGRRRPFRPRGGDEGRAEDDGEGDEAPQEVAPPVSTPPPLPPRGADRYQRPVISDLLREGQEIIVQIAKEPIGQKGARITSHIALPGRYIVYMPTVEHIGVSRKIGTDEERQRLKRTLHTLRAESGAAGGFIVRTAAHGCTTEELREDMQYLVRTWTDIRRRSERVKAPAIAHRDLDLVQRILRDQLSTDFSAIRVDNELEYERIVDFVNRFAPKLVNRVKLYTKETPILENYGVQAEIDKAVKPRVWLKSGGYIVINQTEALVAIDVNTGKFVGKSNRLEDTIVRTNLEAAKEIVRQIRLRDLGGIIVLDFIDMEERRNRQKVMQALEMELRNDRSPSKILQFNDFGLVAITRKRVKQSLERTLCTPCHYCGGGGMIKSAQTICYEILAESRRVSRNVDSHNEVILRVNPEVAKSLRGPERDILNEVEAYLGGVVTIKSDPTVHQEQFDIALV